MGKPQSNFQHHTIFGVPLIAANYIIPAFDDYEKAKEYAGEAFEVIEFKTLQQK